MSDADLDARLKRIEAKLDTLLARPAMPAMDLSLLDGRVSTIAADVAMMKELLTLDPADRQARIFHLLYTQAKTAVDRHDWREALKAVEQLVEQFPDQNKTRRLAEQLPTLRQNAEIQTRKDLEEQFERHLHARRFTLAIEIAERIVHDFPQSPQAEQLRGMLPRLHLMAQST
jgi:hypothetical protein